MALTRYLPNLLTQANLFCGFIGLIHVAYGNLALAGIMVIAAAVFDLLDGLAARGLQVHAKTGKQLDSLADIVSFGILPAVILHFLMIKTHTNWVNILFLLNLPVVALIPFAYAAGAAYRLAKFDVATDQEAHFKGLPVPAAGLLVASLPLILQFDMLLVQYQTIYLSEYVLNPWLILGIGIIVPLLMISNIPMFSLKFQSFEWAGNEYRIVFLSMAIVLFILLFFTAVPLIILLYVLMSILLKNKFYEVQS